MGDREMIEKGERVDARTQKRSDGPTQLTPGAEPPQRLALGQIRVLFILRFAGYLVLLIRDVIAL